MGTAMRVRSRGFRYFPLGVVSEVIVAIVGIIKSHGQVTHLLFPISYLMEVVNSANSGNTDKHSHWVSCTYTI